MFTMNWIITKGMRFCKELSLQVSHSDSWLPILVLENQSLYSESVFVYVCKREIERTKESLDAEKTSSVPVLNAYCLHLTLDVKRFCHQCRYLNLCTVIGL